jgi:hypothetical protein
MSKILEHVEDAATDIDTKVFAEVEVEVVGESVVYLTY